MDIQRTRDALVSFVTHFTKKVLEENDALKKSASQAMYLISKPGISRISKPGISKPGYKDMIPLGIFSDMHQVFHLMQLIFSDYTVDNEPSIHMYLHIMKLDQKWKGRGDCDYKCGYEIWMEYNSTDKNYYMLIEGRRYTLGDLPLHYKPKKPKKEVLLRKNKFGNYEHKDTKIVFSKQKVAAIGVQDYEEGQVVPLTSGDIDICKKEGWPYEEYKN